MHPIGEISRPTAEPLITIAVPSYNQGRFLDQALASIFRQEIAVEVFVNDGGSSDDSVDVIRKWQDRLAGWRSCPDRGQTAAINEGIAAGSAPYVCWLNADDTYWQSGLRLLLRHLQAHPEAPMVYGRTWNTDASGRPTKPYWTAEFSEWHFARRCLVSQPATLIRRDVWEAVGGLDEGLQLSMDYDLWWRILRRFGRPLYLPEFVATNRVHGDSKTASQRRRHYAETVAVVRKHTGGVPLKWTLLWPWSVWYRSRRHTQRE